MEAGASAVTSVAAARALAVVVVSTAVAVAAIVNPLVYGRQRGEAQAARAYAQLCKTKLL